MQTGRDAYAHYTRSENLSCDEGARAPTLANGSRDTFTIISMRGKLMRL